MPEVIISDYFYGAESEEFIYFKIPRLLITDPKFKHVSTDAKLLYTATFASHGETHFENSPQPTQAPAGTEAPDSADSAGMNWAVLVIPAALLLGLAGFGGWKLVNYIKDKKRGYVK